MSQVLLDKNCLLDLAHQRHPWAGQLKRLIDAHRDGEVELAATAITASERPKGDGSPSWKDFEDLLQRAGLPDVTVLPPLLVWNVGFWGKGLWGSPEAAQLRERIQGVLFPALDAPPDTKASRWLNATCDVLTVWTHIWHGTDLLLTRDGRILKRRDALARLGAARIEHPADIEHPLESE